MLLAWLGALVLLGGALPGSQGTEYQGCLFDAKLCKVGEECFDDRVLGRCFNPLQRRPSEMKTYRWFDNRDVDILEEMITIMFDLGYYWDDDYMQCVLSILVNDLNKKQYKHDYTACSQFKLFDYGDKSFSNEVGAVRNAFMLEDGALSPHNKQDEATIRFAPPSDGLYAEEVFYPPATGQPARPDLLGRDSELDVGPFGESAAMMRRLNIPAMAARKRGGPIPGTRAMRKLMMDTVNMDDADRRRLQAPRIRFGPEDGDGDDGSNGALADLALMLMDAEQRAMAAAQAEAEEEGDASLRMFSAHYNTPSSFRQGLEYRGEDGEAGEPDDAVLRVQDVLPLLEGDTDADPRVLEAGDVPLLLDDLPAGPGPRGFSKLYNTPDLFRAGLETKDVESEAEPEVWMDTDTEPGGGAYQGVPPGAIFIRPNRRGSPDEETASSGRSSQEGQPEQEEQLSPQSQTPQQAAAVPAQQQQQQSEPSSERNEEADQAMKELSHLLEAYAAESKGSVPDEIQAEEDEVERAGPSRAYTEGGLVFLPDQQTGPAAAGPAAAADADAAEALDGPEGPEGRSLDALLNEWRGFERRERLDVKKPGPSYNVNNFYFQRDHDEQRGAEVNPADISSESNEIKGEPRFEAIHASPPLSMQHKKPPVFSDDSATPRDPNVVSVKFKNGVSLNDAVSFKVDPAASRLNASEVAKQIMEHKEDIKKRVGVDVQSATAGRSMPLVQSVGGRPWEGDALMLGSIVLGVTLTAAVVSAVTYYAVRRVQLSREKLRGMAAPDTEASKDYQDLCRARMAKKAEAEGAGRDAGRDANRDANAAGGGGHVDQRLASLSRESEGSNNSPSSRSSTSSWTEEPALTNMDISTGHMVLAYMEDHLKNKDRLEQEWQGLCAYEAEPCETTVAQKSENTKKNRYFPHVLPYDHSRVVLNELANATGSDYINASTITDHDPRNPAYLATQGPLPHTAADLWQLVWEQGSVVMVMLSRLTENGTAMCHRYWPEEGSELYHIYEVHLVSEHIWCDDYLVRSFYLKNLKTGETRTVTQFHFLSWPDHGVPPNTKPLLDFRRKVNKSYRGRSCPIVVHCSDGAGRTGTYCLIDMVLNRMAKGAKEIDIAATLEHIRDQRANMVESKEQFEFCLQAVADEVHAILKALPAQPTPPPTAVGPPPTSPGADKDKEKQPQQPAKEQQQQQPPKKKA